jgi:hypothetical protein
LQRYCYQHHPDWDAWHAEAVRLEVIAQAAVNRAVAAWIGEHHYLRSTPPGFVEVYEFLLRGQRVGAALIGRPAARQYNATCILELTRFYFVDDTPTHVESRGLALLRKHVRVWLPVIRLLLAYSDPAQGHEGTIYEADGWAPLGLTAGDNYRRQSRPGRRVAPDSRKQRWVRTP